MNYQRLTEVSDQIETAYSRFSAKIEAHMDSKAVKDYQLLINLFKEYDNHANQLKRSSLTLPIGVQNQLLRMGQIQQSLQNWQVPNEFVIINPMSNGYNMHRNTNSDIDPAQIQIQERETEELTAKADYIRQKNEKLARIADKTNRIRHMTQLTNSMIIDQEEQLDTIDDHVDTTLHETTAAAEQFEKANELNKKNRNTMCIILLIILAVCLALVLFYVLKGIVF
eukprot:TRINITY_DN892_c0_g1_i1.p1 TRINITY_DN892_c0_g1~~TRINITY_DN892_c0_g1_i1.p1  ORF type:complete len:225 (+),score=61.59 TRINITY_DN892_c0_g1_i1:134-808(+)